MQHINSKASFYSPTGTDEQCSQNYGQYSSTTAIEMCSWIINCTKWPPWREEPLFFNRASICLQLGRPKKSIIETLSFAHPFPMNMQNNRPHSIYEMTTQMDFKATRSMTGKIFLYLSVESLFVSLQQLSVIRKILYVFDQKDKNLLLFLANMKTITE